MSNRISHTPLFRALKTHLTLLAAGALALPAAADESTRKVWETKIGPDGKWIYIEKEVKGRQYARPKHQRPTTLAESDTRQPVLSDPNMLDWVSEESLTEEQKKQMADGCCGMYIPPETEGAEANTDPELAQLIGEADNVDGDDDIYTYSGNVVVTQGYRRLRAGTAVLDKKNNVADLSGGVELREPGLLMKGDRLQLQGDGKAAQIDNATFVFQNTNVRGTAAELERSPDNHYTAEDATYTSCPPDSNAWVLKTSEIDIDADENVATAKHVRVNVKDIPIIYIPWMQFPVGGVRKTGVLYPNIELGDRNGLDFALPIYLNLAPNYDATLTPRYISERGYMLSTEFRHLSDWSYTELTATSLKDDDGGDRTDIDPNLEDTTGKDRWLRKVLHQGRYNGFTTQVDYTKISDNLYFRDLGNTTLEVNAQTHLKQQAQLGYNFSNWQLNLQSTQYQTIFENPERRVQKPYKQLPRFDANGDYRWDNGLNLNLEQHAVVFDHDDDDNTAIRPPNGFSTDVNNTYITGSRARLDWTLSWDQRWGWGFLDTGLIARHLTYQLDEAVRGQTEETPGASAPVGYLDTGLVLERDTTLLNGFIQTLEPRIKLLYADFEDQRELPNFDTTDQTFSYNSLWRNDRFSGSDRIGDTQQASLGITTRLLDNATGAEWLRFGVGQIFYFEDRLVSLNPLLTPEVIANPMLLDSNNDGMISPADDNLTAGSISRTLAELDRLTRDSSPVAADLKIKLSKHWQLLTDATWDDSTQRMDRGSFALRYNNNDDTIVNLGYRFTRQSSRVTDLFNTSTTINQQEDIEQADISTVLPLAGNLSLISRWNYDFTNKRDLETFAGVEYDSCCWRVSAVWRRWIDRDDLRLSPSDDLKDDQGIFFQIELKGLAGTSGKLKSILSEGIYGYQNDEK